MPQPSVTAALAAVLSHVGLNKLAFVATGVLRFESPPCAFLQVTKMIIPICIILFMSGVMLFSAALAIFEEVKNRQKKTLLRSMIQLVALLLALYGWIGFFGAPLAAVGGLKWLPERIEYPMGYVDEAVTDREGNYYCPSRTFGRIQVYDKNKRYLRGWFVDACGGVFRININSQDQLEVVTAAGGMHYVFDKNGKLISESCYRPKKYSDFENWKGEFVSIPTSPFLLPMTHFFGSWAIGVFGIILLEKAITRKKKKSPKRIS